VKEGRLVVRRPGAFYAEIEPAKHYSGDRHWMATTTPYRKKTPKMKNLGDHCRMGAGAGKKRGNNVLETSKQGSGEPDAEEQKDL